MSRCFHILIDEAIPFIRGILEPYFVVSYKPGIEIKREDLTEIDALVIRTRTICNQELLENTPVRFIATATIGTDHLDTAYLDQQGIQWMHAPGCNANSVCQYVLASIFEILFETKKSLTKTTLGIVGVGHIGSLLYQYAKTLGVHCLLCDPPLSEHNTDYTFLPLEEVLTQSDIVSLHVPLIQDGLYPTKHLISHDELKKMPSHAFLINASRGVVVDNQALSFHLKEHTIAGAILDVWENEPNLNEELLKQVMFGTPHIAGYSQDGKANATSQVIRGIGKVFNIESLKYYNLQLDSQSLEINTIEEDDFTFLRSVFKKTYDIRHESLLLKSNPSFFESFRKNYPVRREPPAYEIKTKTLCENKRALLKILGFNLCVDSFLLK